MLLHIAVHWVDAPLVLRVVLVLVFVAFAVWCFVRVQRDYRERMTEINTEHDRRMAEINAKYEADMAEIKAKYAVLRWYVEPEVVRAAAVLGIRLHASKDEVRLAYRMRVKSCHPDLAPGAHETFLRLTAAYCIMQKRFGLDSAKHRA